MPKRSLKQIQESLRRKLDEFYEVPVRDIMPGAELDPKKIAQQLRRSPGLYTGTDFSSPDLPQSAAGVASAAGRISGGGKQTGKIEPTLGKPAASTPSRPSDMSKAQWKKMSPSEKQAIGNQSSPTTALPPKPWWQTEKKYKRTLTDKQLTRYNLENPPGQSMGLGTKTAIGATVGTAAVAGLGALSGGETKPGTTVSAPADTQQSPSTDTVPVQPTAAPQTKDSGDVPQAAKPIETSDQDTDNQTTTEPPPNPLQPYAPGTKFSSEILETLDRVLDKYKNFLNEESEQQKLDRERLQALQRGIYGQESGHGKAKTDKPNYAGARGPMQIMPGTFEWMKKSKIIPKDYDIKNPEHNKAAGDALIGHYYSKYQGDPAKVAAAYYAGPGAINKDGTINTHWRDRKNPKAPNVGQYIDSTLGKSGIKDVTYTAAKPSAFTIPPVAAATPAKPPVKAPQEVEPLDTTAATTNVPATTVDTAAPAAKPAFKDVFDYEAFHQASKAGQDLSDLSKFMKTSTKTTAAGLSERYEKFKSSTI